MRTRTTTREGTKNKKDNYPLKLYIWELSKKSPEFRETYETLTKMEVLKVITNGKQISDNEKIIKVINTFLNRNKI